MGIAFGIVAIALTVLCLVFNNERDGSSTKTAAVLCALFLAASVAVLTLHK